MTVVYNIKSGDARLVKLTPSDNWGGAGLLGVTIRLDNYAGAEERIIRVLSCEPKSPAAVAGLVPEKDFILGTTHATLDSADALGDLLYHHVDQVVEFYVYNTDSDLVRTVVLMPTLSWGGDGLLGAEVGTGYLHRLPSHSRSTDGASVERKVRYVQKPETSSSLSTQSVESAEETKAATGTNDETKERDAATRSTRGKTTTVVEYEPQLEMEPADDEKSEASHHEAASMPPPPRALSTFSAEKRKETAKDVFSQAAPTAGPLPPPPKMRFDSPTAAGR